MVCLWCGKKIGLMRGVLDREFCSQVHRRLASKAPDRIAKDIDVTSDYDMSDLWSVDKENKRQSKSGHQAVGVFAVLGIVTLAAVGLATSGSGGGGGGSSASHLPSLNPTASTSSGWGDSMRSVWRSHAQVTLTHDFSQGIGDFIGAHSGGGSKRDWSLDANGLRPGKLRVWQRSTSLQDYDVDFLGQIEQKSMGWAFRAPDIKNFYGTKLTLSGRSANGPNASLIRFVTLDGREQERNQLPIPFTLERGVPYRVHLSVQGSRFVTTVNGQVVSSWSDGRLPRGGVGFFSEEGEVSTVKWVSLAERDSMLGRLLAHFSLIQAPWLGYYEDVEIGH